MFYQNCLLVVEYYLLILPQSAVTAYPITINKYLITKLYYFPTDEQSVEKFMPIYIF